MSDRNLDQLLGAWMDLGPTAAPERVADAASLEVRSTRQTATLRRWPPRRFPDMSTIVRIGLATAAVAVAALLGYAYFVAPNVGAPAPTPSLDAPPASSESTPVAAASLPARPLPGARAGRAAEYGWQGQAGGAMGGMHRVVADGDDYREATALMFAVGPDCIAPREDRPPVPVRVAGLEGVSIEPYEPAVMFNGVGDEITRAYALSVDGRTLCIFLTWHPTTTEDELDSATAILESLRAQSIGLDGIRITFTLPTGWDTG